MYFFYVFFMNFDVFHKSERFSVFAASCSSFFVVLLHIYLNLEFSLGLY